MAKLSFSFYNLFVQIHVEHFLYPKQCCMEECYKEMFFLKFYYLFQKNMYFSLCRGSSLFHLLHVRKEKFPMSKTIIIAQQVSQVSGKVFLNLQTCLQKLYIWFCHHLYMYLWCKKKKKSENISKIFVIGYTGGNSQIPI